MRQVWSVILLAVFGATWVVPVLLADSAANLPACCRRDGMHRCALQDMRAPDSASGPALQAAAMKCPLFLRMGPVSSHSEALGISTARAVFASLAAHPAVRPQVEALYRISFNRASQKRGPPVVLA